MEIQGPVMDSLLNDLKHERERCKSLETKVSEGFVFSFLHSLYIQ